MRIVGLYVRFWQCRGRTMVTCSLLPGNLEAFLPGVPCLATDINEAGQSIYSFSNQVRILLPTFEWLMLIQPTVLPLPRSTRS